MADLVEKKKIEVSVYDDFKNQILTDAKIELKRQISKKISNSTSNYNYKGYYSKDAALNDFVKILFPFRKEKSVKEFFNRLSYTDNYHVKTTYVTLRLKEDNKLEKQLFKSLTNSLNSRGTLYKELAKIKRTDVFPKEYQTKEEIYKSYLFKGKQKQNLLDSIVFLGKREFVKTKKTYEVYFYKSKPHPNSKSYNKDWKLSYIAFKKSNAIGVKDSYTQNKQAIDETKPIEKVIDIETEKVRLKDRKRVNLEDRRNYDYW